MQSKFTDDNIIIIMLSRLIKAKTLLRFFSTVQLPEREQMEYDVLIVGGGVAGLSAAIKIKQMET